MRKIILFALTIISLSIQAQINEHFTDGDFTNNPIWEGDTVQFKVNTSGQLQLNGTGADTSFLSTASTSLINAQWEFYIKQSFNSSSNNYSRVYLASSQKDLSANLNGYFVQFGSTADDLTLNRQDGNQITAIITSAPGLTANSTNQFTVKATRNLSGEWELLVDNTAGNNYQSLGIITDTTYKTSNFFGVFCKYTSSNTTKIYYDDFVVQTIQVDSFPPVLQKITVVSNQQLDLYFDEPLDTLSTSTLTNFMVNNGIGIPSMALLDFQIPSVIHLFFNTPFSLGGNYVLSVDKIEDLKGNKMSLTQDNFTYYIAQQGDIVINEIMADPSPVVSLPDAEYVELFNNSNFPISLKNWHLLIGTKDLILPDTMLQSKSNILLIGDAFITDFQPFGNYISFSGFSLANTGQQLILKDDKGGLIHQVNYTASWYGQSSKADGGWSLELIDPNIYCLGSTNWWASSDGSGGTPGKQNSIFASKPDIATPQITRISVIDSATIFISFSESLDSTTIFNHNAYKISDSIGNPISISSNFPTYNSVQLGISKSVKKGKTYFLLITDTLTDCTGNILQLNTYLPFGMAEPVEKFDLVINEILFDPKGDGVDYVEIYNRSEKIIDLKSLKLANYDFSILDFNKIVPITDEPFAIFPGDYFVLTSDGDVVRKQYFCKNPMNFVIIEDFPSMSNTSGNVYLITASQIIIDSLLYDDGMHFQLLTTYDGVSLERINFNNFNSVGNWHSASESSGFGTPTYVNSQYSKSGISSGHFTINPEVFSPDNDGFDDVLSIEYSLSVGTVISKIIIYDASGRLICNLIENNIPGTNGNIYWDGITNQGNKAPIGIYIAYIETMKLTGEVDHFKKIITIAGKL